MINIGITLGDPAGIGPEIVVKSINSIKNRNFKITLFGDKENYQNTMDKCGLHLEGEKKLDFINTGDGEPIQMGKVTASAGKVAYRSIEMAVQFAMAGKIDTISTAPINKEAIIKAGSPRVIPILIMVSYFYLIFISAYSMIFLYMLSSPMLPPLIIYFLPSSIPP